MTGPLDNRMAALSQLEQAFMRIGEALGLHTERLVCAWIVVRRTEPMVCWDSTRQSQWCEQRVPQKAASEELQEVARRLLGGAVTGPLEHPELCEVALVFEDAGVRVVTRLRGNDG